MTFKHVKAVGNKYYLYEVTSIWDPEKKSPRQKRKYLGCCDAEGNLIPSSRGLHAPNVSKTFGTVWLIDKVATNMRLNDKLMLVSDDKTAGMILALAYQNCIRRVPFERLFDVADESVLSDLFNISDRSTAYAGLGSGEVRAKFTRNLSIDFKDIAIYVSDGTWNAYSYDSGVLLACGFLPSGCSVSDLEAIAESNLSDATNCIFVFDIGFYSKKFVAALYEAGLKFIISVPSDRKVFRSIVSDCLGTMNDAKPVSYGTAVRDIGDTNVKVISYLDEAARAKAVSDFGDALSTIQTAVCNMGWVKGLRGTLRDCYGDAVDCLDVKKGPNGTVEVSVIQQAVADKTEYAGRMAIVTNTDTSPEEIYKICMKSYGFFPSRQDCDTSDFCSFAGFIASIIRNDLIERMVSSGLSKKMDYDDIVNELSKLKVSRFGNEWVLNDISDRQMEIMNSLGIPVPDNQSVCSMLGMKQS